MSSSDERARTTDLAAALAAVAPALEAFLRFTGPDGAARRSQWQPRLAEELPTEGAGAEAVLRLLAEVVGAHGLRLGAPGFCGWVASAAPVVPAVAQLVGAVAAPQRWWVHPGNFLELQAIDWLASLLGLPGATGCFTSGGAAASLLALAAARQRAGQRRGIDVARSGSAALPRPRVYASEAVHQVVPRALATLGLGRDALQRIPASRRGTVDTGALARSTDADLAAGATPIAVVATAGDVHTGAVEPIDELRQVAHERELWCHVDGAYGAFGVLDPRVRALYGDLGRVDSLAVDPHKWLAVPVDCGALLVRDAEHLEAAFALEPASYLPYSRRGDSDPDSGFDQLGVGSPERGFEHSAPARGLWVWAALKEIGLEGMRGRVARHLDCARRVAARVAAEPDLELLAQPVLSICCFRYHPPAIRDTATLERLNRAVLDGVRARGRCIPSSTRVRNKLAIRPCFLGPRTTVREADLLVDEVLAVGRALR